MKRIIRFLVKFLLWFSVLSILCVVIYKYVPVYITPLMVIRYFEGDKSYDMKRDWKPIEEISEELQLAAICAEDQNFMNHNGFDYKAIKKAYKNNSNGKRIKGASTISQQTAKNVFLWPRRSWLRKGLEAYFTVLIEFIWTKERILEVYLNSIEMGDGIFGAEAASNYWFNKPARSLTKFEAAAIAAILPNPRRYQASPRTNYIERRKNWIVKQMGNYGTFVLSKENAK